MFNQTISTTTQLCLDNTQTGYCGEWVINSEITYNYLNLIILALVVIIPIIIIKAFLKRK